MKIQQTIRLVLFAVFLSSLGTAGAQSKKEIKEKGITVIKTYKQDIVNGENEASLDEEEYFNADGELIEYKDYSDNGKRVKQWFRYTYDSNGNCIEEIELDAKGEVKERTVTMFEDGVKVMREYYDDKGRLTRIRKYEYGYSE